MQIEKEMRNISEVWKSINGFEGLYEASSKGRIRSLDRKVKNGNGERITRGVIIKGYVGKDNYKRVSLSKNGKKYPKTVHRLIAETFIDNEKNKEMVNHKDAVKTNNDIENLEWVTRKENSEHAARLGLLKDTPKSLKARVEASAEKTRKAIFVINSKDERVYFKSMREACRRLNLDRRHVYKALKEPDGTHKGYCFEYAPKNYKGVVK